MKHHLSKVKIIFNLSTLIHVLSPSVFTDHFQCTIFRMTLGIGQIGTDDRKMATMRISVSTL